MNNSEMEVLVRGLLHTITAQTQKVEFMPVPQALRWIERLVAEKRVVEVNIDAFFGG